MQIRSTTDRDLRRTQRRKSSSDSKATTAVGQEVSGFQEILDSVLPQETIESRDLHRLWSELPNLERQLIEDQSPENLKVYRELVKAIANQLLKDNVKVAKLKRRVKGGDVELSVVQIIDERLHRMMIMLQSNENTAFQILRNLDEIRGLLMDLRS